MKHFLVLTILAFAALFRNEEDCVYTVVAQNTSADPAQLVIGSNTYTVAGTGLKKEVEVDESEVASLSLTYAETGTEALTLSVYKDDKLITTISGNTYMYVILSYDSATAGGGGIYYHRAARQQNDQYL